MGGCEGLMGMMFYLLLHSDSAVFPLEPLHECRDGVEGGGAKRRGRFDGGLCRHVVFGPLEVATRF